jgi:protein-tyrosine phosphatase
MSTNKATGKRAEEMLNPAFITSTNSDDLLTLDGTHQDHDHVSEMDCRTRIVYESESLWWGIVILFLVIIDFIIWIVELIELHDSVAGALVTVPVSLIVAIFLCFEWLLRLYAVGPSKFFCRILPWVDFVVSFASLILVSYALHVLLSTGKTHSASRALAAINLGRLVRVFRGCFVVCSQRYKVVGATQRLVSQNRRRFKDDEFDLDLTYVTNGIIAMSLPAHKKKDRLYRNNIDDVERFFKRRHSNHYRIYNVTSERRYEKQRFEGNVMTIDIDDHNPAPLIQLQELCVSIDKYLNENSKNVAAIHCKGGKGRTGTAICCYLLHSRALETAKDSLAYFASRRTDHARGNTYQGVQTPSQARYISYYDQMLRDSDLARSIHAPPAYILESVTMKHLGTKVSKTAAFDLLVYDGMHAVRLKKMPKGQRKAALKRGGNGSGNSSSKKNGNKCIKRSESSENKSNESSENIEDENFVVPVHPIATVKGTIESPGSNTTNSSNIYNFNFGSHGLLVRGDVKCRLLSSFKLPGKKYDDSFMYFWFHTAFLNKSNIKNESSSERRSSHVSVSDSFILHLSRNDLDNGHHSKNQKVLPEEYCIDLKFRIATKEEINKSGEYVVKHFDNALAGGAKQTNSLENGIQSTESNGISDNNSVHINIIETNKEVKHDNEDNDNDDEENEFLNVISPWSKQ